MRAAYIRPRSAAEAVAALRDNPGARVLAGGTDLMIQMRLGRHRPTAVVDTSRLPELQRVDTEGDTVLGAGVTMRRLLADSAVVAHVPALADAARLLGGPQIQATATVGGNLCNASPAAETAPPLLVHDAVAETVGPAGTRTIALPDLLEAPGRTRLGADELLHSLRIPRHASGRGVHSAYRRVELRRSVDIAVVSAAVAFEVEDAHVVELRVALGAVAATPILVPRAAQHLVGFALADLVGRSGEPTIEAVARECAAAARPIDDSRASARYRRAMVAVVVGRAVESCVSRARSAAPTTSN